jgi:hypothetical protein
MEQLCPLFVGLFQVEIIGSVCQFKDLDALLEIRELFRNKR